MFRAVIMLSGLLAATTCATAQESSHFKTWPESLQQKGTTPPGWQPTAAVVAPPLPGPLPRIPTERVVITYGGGGRVDEHTWRFMGYRQAGVDVEIRGACLSACTMITIYVGKDRLCIASGAYMGFHAVRSLAGKYMPAETDFMYRQFPAEIRAWIDRYGGWQNLLLDGFWYLGDRELWAMGYPKCK